METRVCKYCGEEKPLTTEYFSWANKAEGKLQTMCKECFRQYMHERWLKIKEEDGERLQRVKDSKEKYAETRMDRIRECHRRYRENHLEEERERCRVKALRQYYEHREEKLAKGKEYKKLHREELAKKKREYCKEHYHNDPVYKRKTRMRNMINSSFYRFDEYTPIKDVEYVGMMPKELRDYLLGTFQNIYGYEWDGVEKVNIDHITPLAQASTIDEVNRLCHYSNLRLVRERDNIAKGRSTEYQIGAC